MNTRFKEIRNSERMSMKKFGEAIGISDSAVARIESGDRTLTDRVIRDICREFKVNETWIRTGEGEMHSPMTKEQELASIVTDLYKDSEAYPFLLEMIEYIKKMDSEQIKAVYKTAKDLIDIYERNK